MGISTDIINAGSGYQAFQILADGVRIQAPSTSFVKDAEAEFENHGAKIVWISTAWYNAEVDTTTNLSTGGTASANYYYPDYVPANGIDGDTGTQWLGDVNTSDWFNVVLLGGAQTIGGVSVYTAGGGGGQNTVTKIECYVDSAYVTAWIGSQVISAGGYVNILFSELIARATAVKVTINGPPAARSSICELKIYGTKASSDTNTVDTTEMISSGIFNLDPATLLLKDSIGTTISGAGKVNVLYNLNAAGFSGSMDMVDFQALSPADFEAATSLVIRIQPVGTQSVGYVAISSVATSVYIKNDGTIWATGSINWADVPPSVKQLTVTDNKTVGDSDSGIYQVVTVDAKTMTLPATSLNRLFIFVNGGVDASVALKIAPNASDKIIGGGFTAEDNKYIINTKSTAEKGDMIVLLGDGVDGWLVQYMDGIWARET